MAQYEITHGPSKFELAFALFHKPIDIATHHLFLTFILTGEKKIKMKFTGCKMNDDTHEAWVIEGFIMPTRLDKYEPWKPCNGFYNTLTLKGFLSFD